MLKSHISQIELVNKEKNKKIFFPIWQLITSGREHDSKSFTKHIKILAAKFKKFFKTVKLVTLDGAYDGFKTYADIFYYLFQP